VFCIIGRGGINVVSRGIGVETVGRVDISGVEGILGERIEGGIGGDS
jgi:hypothetical protein